MEPPEKRACYEVEPDKPDSDEKSAEHQTGWFDLPYEMRKMVLDMVPIRALLRFGKCSKQCYEEVSGSKNYFKEIQFTEKKRFFSLNLTPWFSLEFWKHDMKTKIVCRSPSNRDTARMAWGIGASTIYCDTVSGGTIHWREYVNDHPVDLFLKYFKDYYEKIGRNLVTLRIRVSNQIKTRMIQEVELRNLRKLKTLEIESTSDQICPIKRGFLDFDTVKNVTKDLRIPGAEIDFQQLVQLKANDIKIYYTCLTPVDLNEYVKLWRDGKLHKNFHSLQVRAGYDEKNTKRRIVLDVDGLECETLDETNAPDVSLTVRSSCEWLKDDQACVYVKDNGMRFYMEIE